MNLNRWLPWVLCLAISSVKSEFNSLELQETSLSFSCIDWELTGTCFWLKCKALPPSCSIKTSLKVRHYNPDAVVQVYQTPGKVPWNEMAFVSELAALDQSGATPVAFSSRISSAMRKKQSARVISRHVDVIGSPALLGMSNVLDQLGLGCRSGVTPFMPYYVSMLDYFSWRFPYAEMIKPASSIPGMREVGERQEGANPMFLLTGRFGNVYPRIGSLIQNDHYKASTVFAQRAADIVTDSAALHIYQFLGEKNKKDGWWPPKQVNEWSQQQGKWQMLHPKWDSGCHIFGQPKTKNALTGYKERRSHSGDYAWQLWRPYECCKKKGQKLLEVVDF